MKIAFVVQTLLIACTAVATVTSIHAAEAYPSRTVQLVSPFAAGGTSDLVARAVAQGLSAELGQAVYVENRAGAGGNLGAEFVARSKPDGYTILVSNSSLLAISPLVYSNLRYDGQKDLAPITVLAQGANVLLVNNSVPARSVKDLITLAAAKPDSLNFASSGAGTTTHLAGEMFKQLAGFQMQHLPFRGAGPALTALMGGDVQIMFDNVPSALQLVRSGKVRALAVTGSTREEVLPELPTMVEAGVPGFEVTGWFSLSAPAGTPREVVMRLNTAAQKVVGSPDFRKRMAELGYRPVGGSPERMTEMTRAEIARWAPVVKASGARAE